MEFVVEGAEAGFDLAIEAHGLAQVRVNVNRGGCIVATVTSSGRVVDALCDGVVEGSSVSGLAVEAYTCSQNCELLRALVRVEYTNGSTSIGGETTALGEGWIGGDVILVVASPTGAVGQPGTALVSRPDGPSGPCRAPCLAP